MNIQGKLKASVTVETAMVLPIVLAFMFALLFLILVMYQNAIQLAVMNMNAQYGVNYYTKAFRDVNPATLNFTLKNMRDRFGYLITPDDLSMNCYKIYDINNWRDLKPYAEADIVTKAQEGLNQVKMLDLQANSSTIGLGSSVIIRGKVKGKINVFFTTIEPEIGAVGTAAIINPFRYIRQTDSYSAILTAYTTPDATNVHFADFNDFFAKYLTELFRKGTFLD